VSRGWKQTLLAVPAVLALATVSCFSAGSESKAAAPQLQTISIPVEGMSCMACAARVKRALKGIEGVQQVEVSLEHREAVVRFSADKVSPERLKSAIDALGYKVGKPQVVEAK
jgi:copper ion binding protein